MATAAQLSVIYYGDSSGALRGPQALYEQAKSQGLKVTMKECASYLSSQPTYTLFKRARRNIPRNPIQAYYCGQIFQIDIMDLVRYKSENKHPYVLLGYDTYSKYLDGYPLANRKPPEIIKGLESFIRFIPFPINTIFWDQEGSFISASVQTFLKKAGILNYTTVSDTKAASVERAVRTAKTAIERYFEHTQKHAWEAFLPRFIYQYNHRKHSTTHLRPIDVATDPMIIVPLQPTPRPRARRPFTLPPIGTYVRLNKLRGIFGKESRGTFTREVFRVASHKMSKPIPMIHVTDLQGEAIAGALYPLEYTVIQFSGEKPVDKVLKTRKRKGTQEYFVSYRGYPPKFNSWVTIV